MKENSEVLVQQAKSVGQSDSEPTIELVTTRNKKVMSASCPPFGGCPPVECPPFGKPCAPQICIPICEPTRICRPMNPCPPDLPPPPPGCRPGPG